MQKTKNNLTYVKNQLVKKGWSNLQCKNLPTLFSLMHELTRTLGTPALGRGGLVIERLSPQNKDEAHPSSLSAKYGHNFFPLHNDTAHWLVPCRYIILSCINTGKCNIPTTLLDKSQAKLSEEERALARSATFFVRNGKNSFYSRIASTDNNFIRFDPGCMEPINNDALTIMEAFTLNRQKSNVFTFEWSYGDILIIDNWRMLHGRGNNPSRDSSRCLLRAAVHVY